MSSITPQSNGAVTLIARVFLSILFIIAGFGKLTALSGTAGYFAGLGLPLPMVTAVVVGLVEFVGGIAILVGFRPVLQQQSSACSPLAQRSLHT